MNGLRRNDDEESTTAGTKNLPSVAIVILNWNGRSFLEKFLPSVLASTYGNKRVIVADNGSVDDSVAFLRSAFPQVEILPNSTNEGFAKGYNIALKQVECDYYVLLNSDVEVTPGWISPIIELMESDVAIAACQPKLLAYDDKTQFEYAGASGGWLDNFGYPFARGRIFEVCEKDTGQYDSVQQCFWASGAALFVRSDAYHKVGGLDEYFFAHQEEIDLCWRLQRAGYKIFVQPASVVYHVGAGTLPKHSSHKTYLNFRNNLIMLAKNFPRGMAFWKIPMRLGLDQVSAWRGLLSGDGSYFIAIYKAQIHFWRWLLFTKKPRSASLKKGINLSGYYKRSVAWAYFIRKKNRFSEIVGNK